MHECTCASDVGVYFNPVYRYSIFFQHHNKLMNLPKKTEVIKRVFASGNPLSILFNKYNVHKKYNPATDAEFHLDRKHGGFRAYGKLVCSAGAVLGHKMCFLKSRHPSKKIKSRSWKKCSEIYVEKETAGNTRIALDVPNVLPSCHGDCHGKITSKTIATSLYDVPGPEACKAWFTFVDAGMRAGWAFATAKTTTNVIREAAYAERNSGVDSSKGTGCHPGWVPPSHHEQRAALLKNDLSETLQTGRRAAMLSTGGTFTLSAGSNRAGNDEEEDEEA